MKSSQIVLYGLIFLTGACSAAGKPKLLTETDRINYSVGYQIGGDFKSQNVEVSSEAMVQGMQDALKGNNPLLAKSEMETTLINLKRKVVESQRTKASREGADFLAKNAKQKDVKVLPSGVQYKILRAGSGKEPTINDEVRVHYRITRADGSEIGSTYVGSKPRVFPVSKALPGLREVLLLMPQGSKWQIVLPTASAARGQEPMDDLGVLIYELELLSVLPASDSTQPPALADKLPGQK